MSKKREYRRPDLLPKLRKIPKIGDLVAVQDLDATIFPAIVIDIVWKKTKKGHNTKTLIGIEVLIGLNRHTVNFADLKRLPE